MSETEDIVHLLERFAAWVHPEILQVAADEITRLRAQLAAAEERVKYCEEHMRVDSKMLDAAHALLREVLGEGDWFDNCWEVTLSKAWYEQAKKEVGDETTTNI